MLTKEKCTLKKYLNFVQLEYLKDYWTKEYRCNSNLQFIKNVLTQKMTGKIFIKTGKIFFLKHEKTNKH